MQLERMGVRTALDFAQKDRAWLKEKRVSLPYQKIWAELNGGFARQLGEDGDERIGSIIKSHTFKPTRDRAFILSKIEKPGALQSIDEVLRLYPPAWIGPRRAVRDFEFGGYSVPRGAYVNYCSWASHRIPEVFPEPEAFIPERFTRERKAALPRGAYVPFGGGRRICIGKRFGQTEVKLVATMLLQRLRLDAMPGRTMTVGSRAERPSKKPLRL